MIKKFEIGKKYICIKDFCNCGHNCPGVAGYIGTVAKIEGGHVYFRNDILGFKEESAINENYFVECNELGEVLYA
jgi:hypothetical protein